MIVRILALSSLLALTVVAASAPALPPADDTPPGPTGPAPLLGQVEGTTYKAPTGAYKIAVPVLPELGGRITDNENIVTFEDDFNTHISIACFPLNLEQKWELDTRGIKEYLTYFFANFVLADFQTRYRGSSIESAKFIPNLLDGTLLAYALLPGGSFFEGRNSVTGVPTDPPAVAKRGNLCFVKNGFVYVISSELAERATQRRTYKKTTEEEDQILRQRLLDLANRLEFIKPPPAPAKK